MIPDITPWSYPNRNTPNETKTLVKYLKSVSSYNIIDVDISSLQQRLPHQAMDLTTRVIPRHHEGQKVFRPADGPWRRLRYTNRLLVDASVCSLPLEMILLHVPNVLLLPAAPASGSVAVAGPFV